MFSSQTVSQVIHELEDSSNSHNILAHGMNLEDLIMYYAALKNKQELDLITWWLLKPKVTRTIYLEIRDGKETNNPEHDIMQVTVREMQSYVRKTILMNQHEQEYLIETVNAMNIAISADEPLQYATFRQSFGKLLEMPAFQWLNTLFRGFQAKHLNYESDNKRASDDRRLSQANLDN
jgi:hypothetical protein